MQKIYETIADIAYIAGTCNYYSGDSRADMQLFISLAKKFHEFYAEEIEASWELNEKDYISTIEKFTEEKLKTKRKLELSYPSGFKNAWDNLEIERCRQDETDTFPVHDDSEEPNDFWSVYAHQVDGGVMCVADLPTQEDAEKLVEIIRMAIRTFTNNGFLSLYSNEILKKEFNIFLDEEISKYDRLNFNRSKIELIKHKFNQMV